MTPEEFVELWKKKFKKNMTLNMAFKERDYIQEQRLTVNQYEWLMGEYGTETPYPNLSDFLAWTTDRLKEDSVPEDLCCTAYLDGSPVFIEAAEDLENLKSAWFPTEETDKKIERLRAALRNAFVV